RDFVTINVSEFFRIPEKFEYLRRNVLPTLLASRRQLRVWSAGCSNGAEPYSLAILLRELAPAGDWRITASDIDATVLEKARRGIYPVADIRNLTSEMLKKYFIPVGEQLQVVDQIKNKVQFRVHDLLRDEYDKDFDLIVCRHVIIYFTEEAKDEIFRKFHSSLRTGGVLFVGGTEMIKKPREMGYESLAVSFYRKSEPLSADRQETTYRRATN
ncbi:MAG: methyltransferase domain-containing protein, partial [Dehalococcoidales bacterium]|nr:methyltransferase domain-containing protein [Dehalococcoidales bacterium]